MNTQCKKLYKTYDLHAHWLQHSPKVEDIWSTDIEKVKLYAFGVLCPSGETIDYSEVHAHILVSTERDEKGKRIWCF